MRLFPFCLLQQPSAKRKHGFHAARCLSVDTPIIGPADHFLCNFSWLRRVDLHGIPAAWVSVQHHTSPPGLHPERAFRFIAQD